MPDTTEVTYVGTCKGLIEKKNGWYAVEIAVPGKQYTYKAGKRNKHFEIQTNIQ